MKTYAFIDAANLFYGGLKSLGWAIDYNKLIHYLHQKYEVEKVFYFGGIEVADYTFDYLSNTTVPLEELEEFLLQRTKKEEGALLREMKRLSFYKKLKEFGYHLILKPVKEHLNPDGSRTRKANCDVDMTLYLITHYSEIKRAIVLTGDGDFLPVLKHLKDHETEITILARAERAAKEIRQFAKGNFRDFARLRTKIEFEQKERAHKRIMRPRCSNTNISNPIDKSTQRDYK
jgi:uncharacterized LabA/DUF88 family protein